MMTTTGLPKAINLKEDVMLDIIKSVIEAYPSVREVDIKIAGDVNTELSTDVALALSPFTHTEIDRMSFQIDGRIIRFTLVK